MKRLILNSIFIFALLTPLISQNMADYCAVPPYISTAITPNVLLIFDNSGSMMKLAYPESYDRNRLYYGYFDPTKRYSYSSTAEGYFYEDSNGGWSGNWLNWASMRRIDVARKVMVGGLCQNRANPSSIKYLVGEPNPDRDFDRGWFNDSSSPYQTPYHGNYYYGNRDGKLYVDDDTSPFSSPIAVYTIKVHIGTQEPLGVLQKTAVKVRWGLMFFNTGNKFEDGGGTRDGGYLQNDIGDLNTSIVTNIENITPDTWTPSSEALYEAVRVFQGGKSAYNGGVNYAPKDPIQYYCQKNFVIFVTDGNPTKDKNIPGGAWGTPNPTPPGNSPEGAALPDININTMMTMINSNEGGSPYCRSAYDQVTSDCGYDCCDGTFYLEGVAYWAHITDLRPDVSGYQKSKGKQNLHIYTVFAFAQQESIILKLAAKYGGFDDMNGNNRPDLQAEWDKNGDGDPDNYYQASGGYGLERALIAAINDILERTSSGTAASVLSTSTRGAISMLQAFFTPRYVTVDKELTWTGHLQYLWLDQKYNIREDTPTKDDRLILNHDKIIQPYLDTQTNNVKVRYFSDNNGDGRADFPCTPDRIGSFDEISAIWRAESLLLFRDPDERTIYTFLDTNKNGRPDSGEFVEFETSRSSSFAPYFRVSSSEAEKYIRYIRGEDLNICLDPPACTTFGYRDRTILGNVWKLGDIVHSTPKIVGNIALNSYHIDYMDTTYQEFIKGPDPQHPTLYETRPNVVYFGGNDGMLHCVHMGKLVEDKDPNNPVLKAHLEGTGRGQELWAYIPYNLLPQVPWLGYPDYCHIYYVDGRTLIFDASINGPSGGAKTKDSWRTILVGTMRLGGKPISINGDFGQGTETRTFRSAIFAMDVTDPREPTLLWEFTDPDLGFTTSFPAIVRFGDRSNNGDWYLVFGNGPENFSGRDQTKSPKLYVVDLRTGELKRKIEIDSNIKGYLGDLIAIDPDKDYQVDTIYAGTVEMNSNPNKPLIGRVLRIQTMESSNPNSWAVSTLINPQLPITASPEVVFDEKRNIWVLFGTGIFLSVEDKSITYPQSLFGVRDNYWNGASGSGEVSLNEVFTMDLSDSNPANDYDVTAEAEDFTCYCNGIEVPEMIQRDANGKKIGCIQPAEKVVTYVKDAKVGTTNWKEHLNYVTTNFKGWRLIIPINERCITKPFVIAGLADFLVYTPTDDPCAMGGETKMYTLFYQTGTAFLQPIYLTSSAVSGGKLQRSISLGPGAPPPGEGVAAAITKEGNIEKFVQVSTGVVIQGLQQPPFNIKSRIVHWMEK